MSNELTKLDALDDLLPQKYSDETFDAAASGSSFLPRLQLMTSNSEKCKTGEFPTNHYALVSDQKHDDLGKNVDVLLLVWRPKALDTGGDVVISVYDVDSEEFARIQDRSLNVQNSNCMFGPEFLVWIPSIQKFATFFCGTKSSRREAGNIKALLKKPATLTSQKCSNKSFTWFAPQVSACSTPFDLPQQDKLVAAVEQFNNPPEPEVETVQEEGEEARAR